MDSIRRNTRQSHVGTTPSDTTRAAPAPTPPRTPPRSPKSSAHGMLDNLSRFARSPLRAATPLPEDPATRSPAPTLTRQTAFSKATAERLGRMGFADEGSSSQAVRPQMPPAKTYPKATLQWPDGHVSEGVAVKLGKNDYRFHVDQSDPALTSRKGARNGAATLPLKVEKEKVSMFRRSQKFTASLPSAKSAGLQQGPGAVQLRGDALKFENGRIISTGLQPLSVAELNGLFQNLGYEKGAQPGVGAGLKRKQQVAVLDMFSSAVNDLARRHPERPALRSAAQALANPIYLQIGTRPDPARAGLALASGGSQSPDQARQAVARLKQGEHIYFPVIYGPRGVQHAVGVSVSRTGTDENPRFRVSMTDTERQTPGMFVDISARRLFRALPDLVNGTLGQPAPALAQAIAAPNFRKPLRQWLASLSPSKSTQSAYFDDKVLRQPVQAGSSCVSENAFAFLATVLPPSDYKLAKAASLNVALQLAQQHFAAVGGGQEILARMKERATSALAGSTVG